MPHIKADNYGALMLRSEMSATAVPKTNPPLGATERQKWLTKDIPHRVRAVLLGIRHMRGEWNLHFDFPNTVAGHCAEDGVHEGRLSAMRWLIMFVGIGVSTGTPSRANLHRDTDVRIDQIDPNALFPLNDSDAIKLAQVGLGCSQATGHPTQGTNHPSVNEEALSAALTIIIAHLQNTIYTQAGLDLKQETLKPARP